jgi:hypothetical protein
MIMMISARIPGSPRRVASDSLNLNAAAADGPLARAPGTRTPAVAADHDPEPEAPYQWLPVTVSRPGCRPMTHRPSHRAADD